MKETILILLTLFTFQFSSAQTEKLMKGKVSDKEFALQGVDVINFSNQKSTVTNIEGVFYILAKANDILLIHRKNYTDTKITLTQMDLKSGSFKIELIVKPIELEEVIVDKGKSVHLGLTQADFDGMKLVKNQQRAKVEGINDGSIPNGVDFVRLGKDGYKLIKKMFISGKKDSRGNPEIGFKEYVKTNINKDYFTKNLKLQPSEISLFLDFCDADSKSKTVMTNANILALMDFMSAKNIEFQKILTLVK
jgi:hypothetical protein